MKRIAAGLLACTMALSLVACGGSQPAATDSKPAENNESAEVTDVALKVWAPQDDQPDANGWLPQMEAKFEAEHPEYKITWTNEVCGEDVAKDQVTKDPAAAADVYMFANDQLGELMAANGIAKLGGSYLEQVQADNSQTMVDSVTAPDGSVYGFPVAANTWFCYYNKDVYTEEDVKSLDTMLEKGVVAFPTKNSWYLGSFFFANGATAFGPNGIDAADGVKFGADNGVAALNAILDMVSNPNYRTDADGLGNSGMKSGEVAAYFSGSWEYDGLKEALGDKLGACQLPTATIGGEAKLLKSFAGSKAVAVNPNTANSKAAMQFAAFLASVDAQKARYEIRSAIPVATALAEDPTIAADTVASAILNTIANTSVLQPTLQEMGNWWTPIETLGNNIVNGAVTKDNAEKSLTDTLSVINGGGL